MKPSGGPWRHQDHQGKGYKIVDPEGKAICYIHYPSEIVDYANLRLIELAPDLYERLKALCWLMELSIRVKTAGGAGDVAEMSSLAAARELIQEIENPKLSREPGEEG